LERQAVIFKDLGIIDYKSAWDYQEELVAANREVKTLVNGQSSMVNACPDGEAERGQSSIDNPSVFPHLGEGGSTSHYLLFCEHPAVYTWGKSGSIDNVLLSEEVMEEKEIAFFRTNRGGDITFHGLQQVVGYPILDLEKFYTDIGRYLRELEEVIILTIGEYGLKGERSKGETGVWIDPGVAGKERKICAMGIRCSRWITMHGFALNVNTDLSYFNNIIPCGIQNKQVTSIEKELGHTVDIEEVKEKLKKNFAAVFGVDII
jgi:lipoyl(octanoyl) transferase